MTERRPYFWRTLRSDFLDMCDRNVCAALLLDYFHTNEITSMGRRTQGARDSGYYELSRSFASAVVLIDVSKNTVKNALNLLIAKGYITPHPENGRSGWINRNRYRPNLGVILQDAADWQNAHPNWSNEIQQLVNPDQSIGQTGPIQLVKRDQSIGQTGPQESVKDREYETPPHNAPAVPAVAVAALTEIDQLITDLLGHPPTKPQQHQMLELWSTFPPDQIRQAVATAHANDKRHLNYVRGILDKMQNGKPAPAAAQPERVYFTAPEDDAPAMTPEEMAEVRAQLKALRSGQS